MCIGLTVAAGVIYLLEEGLRSVDWGSPLAVGIYTFFGTLALIIVLAEFITKGAERRYYEAQKAKGFVDNVTASLLPDRIDYSTAFSSGWTDWCVIEHVGHTDDHTIILISERVGYIIPWRAFGSRADAQLFLETAERYWNARRS
jgi:hypothetical protein